MGSLSPKKAAAIVAAVLQHVCDVEARAAQPASPPRRGEAAGREPLVLPLWAWGGRQQAMQDRLAWQRRLGKSW